MEKILNNSAKKSKKNAENLIKNSAKNFSKSDKISRENYQKKILILEDDEWFSESLAKNLGEKFDVKIARNPEKVFEILDDFSADLILADVILGAKNLFVLLNEMQSYVDTREIPIAILSSISAQINEKDVREFNVKIVLDKAEISPKILREKLDEIIENSEKEKKEENKKDEKDENLREKNSENFAQKIEKNSQKDLENSEKNLQKIREKNLENVDEIREKNQPKIAKGKSK